VSRVLLTGATGFVGTSVLAALRDRGDDVHVVSRRPPPASGGEGSVTWHLADLLDPGAARQVVAEVAAERLVHLAWEVPPGRFWTGLENVAWVEASLRLLRAFDEAGGRRAVLAGTCAEYAWGGEGELDEVESPANPRTLYGTCKDAVRRVAAAYAEEAGIAVAWGRLFFLYGPREHPDRLVPSVIRALLAGERVATSAGAQVRDFMHVDDVAGALVALLGSEVTGPVNIASGVPVSVGAVLDRLGDELGVPEGIDRGARPASDSEPARIVASVERLVREVGFKPGVSLEDGLAATIAWWREQG
jgi:nucleoside-diphosphate-sugar epimerase